MKRYLVFKGSTYHPSGGMKDFFMDCDCIDECLLAFKKYILKDYNKEYSMYNEKEYLEAELGYAWTHIYDSKDKKIVLEKGNHDFYCLEHRFSRYKIFHQQEVIVVNE